MYFFCIGKYLRRLVYGRIKLRSPPPPPQGCRSELGAELPLPLAPHSGLHPPLTHTERQAGRTAPPAPAPPPQDSPRPRAVSTTPPPPPLDTPPARGDPATRWADPARPASESGNSCAPPTRRRPNLHVTRTKPPSTSGNTRSRSAGDSPAPPDSSPLLPSRDQSMALSQ